MAVQYRVVSRSGVDVASACLAHVNRNYVRGESVDAMRLFRIRNLTRRVQRLQPKVTFQLGSQFRVLAMSAPPNIKSGSHCTDPVTCEFFDHCIRIVRRITSGSCHASTQVQWKNWDVMGVDSIRDIPDDFELTEIQRRAATCVQTGEPWYSPELRDVLAGLTYPLYFADFETVNRAIPPFAGMRPYDHFPFQWSVHIQHQPGAEPEHYEFLAMDDSDPRREFISALCDVLGESGSIVVYSSFESKRLSELAARLPVFGDRINAIQARLFDLLPVVREHVYHPAFAGSYSIKSVLPALVPEMTYDGMAVSNGQDTGLAWESLVRGSSDWRERNRIRRALLDYCGQDTLAMVRLLEKVRSPLAHL